MFPRFISGFIVIASSAMLGANPIIRYDRAAERTYTGTVKAVASFPAPNGAVGVHLDLITDQGIISVHLGPALFIGQQNFWFFAEDQVEIVGARMSDGGNSAVWAKAVMKGSQMLALRTDDGTPKWTPADEGTDGCGVAHLPLQRGTER